jgi:diadenosine tetraphosphate (Ap4A) HIT family hydrolase
MNATMIKFGYPASLLLETEHWCVLLRPQQVTFASLVLAAKSDVFGLHDLPNAAFAEMAKVTRRIAAALNRVEMHDKINYLALMMVDPHVHFHVLPRYGKPVVYRGVTFADPGWPALPDLKSATVVDDQTRAFLKAELLDAFNRNS